VAPFVAIPPDVRRKALDALELAPGDRVIELGCGRGDFLIQLARERGIFGTGIELDPLWFSISWIRTKFPLLYLFHMKQIEDMKKGDGIQILYGNLFDMDLSGYTKVYAYLMKRAYPRLKEKFERELKPGSIVVLAGWPLDDQSDGHRIVKEGEERLFVYRY
jgi:SAM-dependent methyltransferase